MTRVTWTELKRPPLESGRYVVGHRGHSEVIFYAHPNDQWMPGTKIGWRKDPEEFRATHYFKLPEITHEMMKRARS